jgi:hypothetical protein
MQRAKRRTRTQLSLAGEVANEQRKHKSKPRVKMADLADAQKQINVGQQFERWTVLELPKKIGRKQRCLCQCVCGTKKLVVKSDLLTFISRSCGCLRNAILSERSWKHGRRHGNLTYLSWSHIRQRCGDPNHRSYPRYGGRGITICARWDDFNNFLADMGERPSKGHSIERRNNDGHYEPSNCFWATMKQQSGNKRNTHWVEWEGERVALSHLAQRFALPPPRLFSRLQRGWPLAVALKAEVDQGTPWWKRKRPARPADNLAVTREQTDEPTTDEVRYDERASEGAIAGDRGVGEG